MVELRLRDAHQRRVNWYLLRFQEVQIPFTETELDQFGQNCF